MLNTIQLQGRLTADPEIRYFEASGAALATFTLAQNQRVKDQDVSHFFECKLWGKQAETLANHVKKGAQIIVEGSIEQERWESDGQKRSKVVIRVGRFHFCERREAASQPAPQQGGDDYDMPF